jgi:hypothetical protein
MSIRTWFAYDHVAWVQTINAAEPSATNDPLAWLINLGVAGIVIVLLITGQLRTKSEVDRLERVNVDQKDSYEKQLTDKDRQLADKERQLDKRDVLIEALREQLTNRTIPALARVGDVVAAYPQQRQSEEELHDRMEGLVSRVEAMQRRLDNE